MKPTYLTHSRIAHVSLASLGLAALIGTVVSITSLPLWLMPVCYFGALIAAAVLVVGWVRWTDPTL